MLKLHCNFAELALGSDLSLSINGKFLEPNNRTLDDLRPVLFKPETVEDMLGNFILYCMFRSVVLDIHKELFEKNGIRFDITVLKDVPLGPEANKTLGHYHPLAKGGLSYAEVYQVLSGSATFLLQKREGTKITDFAIVEAHMGEAVLIPPNYGHVTINSGVGPLVMCNLVSDRFSSIYEDYIKKGGAAYYLLRSGGIVSNKNYSDLPPSRVAKVNFTASQDLYSDFIINPSRFLFLNDPSQIGTFGHV